MNTSSDYSNRPGRRYAIAAAFVLFAALFSISGCEEYDAPPEVLLEQPEGGAFLSGKSIRLQFTEPIDTSTLAIQVWPTERGTSRLPLEQDIQPIISSCTLKSANNTHTCGDITLRVDEDGMWAEVDVDGDMSMPGVPMILEVISGLADLDGNKTGVSRFFDFQFRFPVENCSSDVDVDFDDGVYILSATVQKPMTAVLTLVTHMVTLPDGNFAMAGAKGQVIGDGPKTERDPEKIKVTDNKSGFALFAKGCVIKLKNGRRILGTEPVDVELPVLSLILRLTNVRIFAEVKRNPETGKDRIDGTLSYEALQLINEPKVTNYDGATTAAIADFVPEAVIPQGHPELCGNLCGIVKGICIPPLDFPAAEFCP